MPFWGFDCGGGIVTWIITNPYNNTIRFSGSGDLLEAEFAHEFTRFHKEKKYGFHIILSKNASPIEPALQFRRRLKPTAEVNLIPMIDVVFQLVIFFMVSTTFLVNPGISIVLPGASTSEPVAMTKMVVSIKSETEIFFNNAIGVNMGLELYRILLGFRNRRARMERISERKRRKGRGNDRRRASCIGPESSNSRFFRVGYRVRRFPDSFRRFRYGGGIPAGFRRIVPPVGISYFVLRAPLYCRHV